MLVVARRTMFTVEMAPLARRFFIVFMLSASCLNDRYTMFDCALANTTILIPVTLRWSSN